MRDIKNDPFEEYIKNLPPSRKELGQAWSAAIGLQDVDGLKPSEYLYDTAKKSIDGEISVEKYLLESQRFFQKKLSHFHRHSIFQFIENYF